MRQCRAAIVLISASLVGACGGTDLHEAVHEMGYQELEPPSMLVPPGTIVVVRHVNPTEVAVVCTQGEVVNAGALVRSPTKSVAFAGKTRSSFDVGADYLRSFGVDAKASHVKRTSMTLSKAEVWEIPDSAIEASLSMIGADCRKAIEVRLEHFRRVGLVKSVLKADVVYAVELDDSVDAAARAEIMTDLALKVGGTVSSASSSQITGEGLFWGIVTDTDFFPSPRSPIPALPAPPALGPGARPIVRIDPKGADASDYP